jgi:hypothetical protein
LKEKTSGDRDPSACSAAAEVTGDFSAVDMPGKKEFSYRRAESS